MVQGGCWADPGWVLGCAGMAVRLTWGWALGWHGVSEPGQASGTGLGEGEAWRGGVCPEQGMVPGSGG